MIPGIGTPPEQQQQDEPTGVEVAAGRVEPQTSSAVFQGSGVILGDIAPCELLNGTMLISVLW